MALQVGTILRHRYRIDGVLGHGGMGAVYKAFDLNLGVEVAVKENLFTTAEFERQFEREARILARLRHPNLPRVSEHFVIEGEGQYLVMDFIQGVDLRQRLERSGPIQEEEALPWFLEICDALAYLHSQAPPILHRDIKPGNIKIMPDGHVVLVDFGLAKFFEHGGATATGAKAMTPGFSPPEQYGTGGTDPRSDVYSLGATMFAALTACIPEDSIERSMGHAKLTSLRKLAPDVSAAVARTIEKALEIKPKDRYQTIADFAIALRTTKSASRPTVMRGVYPYLEKTVIKSEQHSPLERVTRVLKPADEKPSRLPLMLILGLTTVLIVAGIAYMGPTIGAWLEERRASPVGSQVVPTESGSSATLTRVASDASPSAPAGVDSTNSVSSQESPDSTRSAPAVSTPTGGGVGQLAYVSEKSGKPQIYLINLDGTDERQLTSLTDGACQPAWDSKGVRMIFTSPCLRNKNEYQGSSLWLITLDDEGNASDPEPLPIGPGGNFDPAWAPDGRRIAFTSLRDGRPQVYVLDLETNDLINVNNDLGYNYQPVWSPTGEQIMFASTRGGETSIWVLPADGGEAAQRFSRGEYKDDSHPDWSLDGRLILFVRRRPEAPPLLYTARYEDRGFTESRICFEGDLTGIPKDEAKWSPDGNWIAFETWPDGVDHNIAVMTSSCTLYAEITTDPANDYDVTWRSAP